MGLVDKIKGLLGQATEKARPLLEQATDKAEPPPQQTTEKAEPPPQQATGAPPAQELSDAERAAAPPAATCCCLPEICGPASGDVGCRAGGRRGVCCGG